VEILHGLERIWAPWKALSTLLLPRKELTGTRVPLESEDV
jgi:hypothetical protein